MNVYDFDKTIYKKDCTYEFYKHCLRRKIRIMKYIPKQIKAFINYHLGLINKTQMKEVFYLFLKDFDVANEVEVFWDKQSPYINSWYKKLQKNSDIIISASPEFLIKPICKRLSIKHSMASKVNVNTGKYTGINCHGKEKVRRYNEKYSDKQIDNFYSDSLSDTPLAILAKDAYIVRGEQIQVWNTYKQSLSKRVIGKMLEPNYFPLLLLDMFIIASTFIIALLFHQIMSYNLAFIISNLITIFIASILKGSYLEKNNFTFITSMRYLIQYVPNIVVMNTLFLLFYNYINMPFLIATLVTSILSVFVTYLFDNFIIK